MSLRSLSVVRAVRAASRWMTASPVLMKMNSGRKITLSGCLIEFWWFRELGSAFGALCLLLMFGSGSGGFGLMVDW